MVEMNLVFELSCDDNCFVGFTKDDVIAEYMVIEKFKEISSTGDRLIRIENKGERLYAIQKQTELPFEDEFEYVDNDGNPINSDGTELLESEATVEKGPEYELMEDFVWFIKKGVEDVPVSISSSEHYFSIVGSPTSPFTLTENVTIISTN